MRCFVSKLQGLVWYGYFIGYRTVPPSYHDLLLPLTSLIRRADGQPCLAVASAYTRALSYTHSLDFMHLVHRWQSNIGAQLKILTVDHFVPVTMTTCAITSVSSALSRTDETASALKAVKVIMMIQQVDLKFRRSQSKSHRRRSKSQRRWWYTIAADTCRVQST